MSSEWSCRVCHKVCKDKRGLGVHEKKCMEEREEPPLECEACNESFKTINNLRVHQSRCKILKDILLDKHKKRDEEINRLQNLLNQLQTTYETRIETITLKHDTELETLSANWNNKLKSKENDIVILESKHNLEKESLISRHKGELMLKDVDLTIMSSRMKELSAQVRSYESRYKELEHKLEDKIKENKSINCKYVNLLKQRSSSSGGTTIYNIYNIQNNFKLHLKHLEETPVTP